jgi:hypothetical protein
MITDDGLAIMRQEALAKEGFLKGEIGMITKGLEAAKFEETNENNELVRRMKGKRFIESEFAKESRMKQEAMAREGLVGRYEDQAWTGPDSPFIFRTVTTDTVTTNGTSSDPFFQWQPEAFQHSPQRDHAVFPETPVAVAAPRAEADEEYLGLAQELGISSAAVDRERLLRILEDEGIPIYDPEKVNKWMDHKTPQGKTWKWFPVRSKDLVPSLFDLGTRMQRLGVGTYRHRIPMPVLETIAKISHRMEEAVFFITDYEDKRPDPFLAVSTKSMASAGELFIIERWDEPGFRR